MNTTIVNFAITGSLIIALLCAVDMYRAEPVKDQPTASSIVEKIVLNHNETLVKDVEPRTKTEAVPTGSEEPAIGAVNPIRRPAHDAEAAASIKIEAKREIKPDARDSWVMTIWDFFFGGARPPGSDCDEFGCGGNHNETLVKDPGPVTTAETQPKHRPIIGNTPWVDPRNRDWPASGGDSVASMKIPDTKDVEDQQELSWADTIWDFFFGGARPPGGDCDDFGCGMNHNETLVHENQMKGEKQ